MNQLRRTAIALGLAALLAGLQAYGATLNGSVRTADGDPIAATVSILYSLQGVSLEAHETGEDGTFSIEIRYGARSLRQRNPRITHRMRSIFPGVSQVPSDSLFARCGSSGER